MRTDTIFGSLIPGMRLSLTAGLLCLCICARSQNNPALTEYKAFQDKLLLTYHNLKGAPEDRARLKELKSLPFFPYDF